MTGSLASPWAELVELMNPGMIFGGGHLWFWPPSHQEARDLEADVRTHLDLQALQSGSGKGLTTGHLPFPWAPAPHIH